MLTNELVISALAEIDASIEAAKLEFDKLTAQGLIELSSSGLIAFEDGVIGLSRRLAALYFARSLQLAVVSDAMTDKT